MKMDRKNHSFKNYRSEFRGKRSILTILAFTGCLTLGEVKASSAAFEKTSAAIAQQQTRVSGTVVDEQGEPLIGVTVKVKGSGTGTVTDIDGKFLLEVDNVNEVLVFTYIGFGTRELKASEASQQITLSSSSTSLNEVVAIGYATVQRKELTGASVSVSGDELKIAPVTTAAQALTGKAAGVNIVTQSGAPGADYNIFIRGGTTLNGDASPLYIVDGFQMDEALSKIDINDIESIDIMKDASSTAIYGSRGANGVVIITTKSGKSGKTEFSYNNYIGIEKLSKKLDLLQIEDYVKYQYEFQTLAGTEDQWASYFGGDITSSDFYTGAFSRIESQYGNREGIDWQDEVFGGTAITQNHNINMTGGNEKTRFLLSFNNTGQNGILDKHDYNKNTIRLKLNHEIAKGIRSDFNTSFQSRRIDGGGSLGGALKMTILQPVTGGIRYTNEELINTDVGEDMLSYNSQYDVYNPIITNDAVDNNEFNRLFTVNAGLEFDIAKNLMFRTAGSYMWEQQREDYWDDGRTRTAQNNGGPYGGRNNDENFQWQITNTLNWGKDFGEHKVNLLLGQETVYSESINLDNTYYKFPESNFGLNNVGQAAIDRIDFGSGKSTFGLTSFFGRGSYNFGGKYIANFTLRADGSSKFEQGNKWGFFPSASAAWRISEEAFMKDQDLINNLKLRIGYGTAGNNRIDNNLYATTYGGGSYAIGNGNFQTLVPGDIVGNPEIVWEKTASTNIGLDIDLWKSRLAFSFDVYDNKSDDLLIKNLIPESSGYRYQIQNIGAIRNRGFEAIIRSYNINTKNFKWNSNFNIGFNKSKVLAIYGKGANDSFIQNASERANYLIEVGKPLGQFYGYYYDGVYTTDDFNQNPDGTYNLKDGVPRLKGGTVANIKPGDVKYRPTAGEVDENGNPVWSTADRRVIGNAQPKFQGGLSNIFSYKNFDLTIFMNFSYGGEVFNMNTQRFIGPYLPNQNMLSLVNDRYVLVDPQTGRETTDLARLAALNPQQYSKEAIWSLHSDNKIAITDFLDYYLEDASFLRINTVTLGYTLPKDLIQRIKLKNVRVYGTLNNPYVFTGYSGYDPEVSATSSLTSMGIDNSAYPRARSVVFGLNVSF